MSPEFKMPARPYGLLTVETAAGLAIISSNHERAALEVCGFESQRHRESQGRQKESVSWNLIGRAVQTVTGWPLRVSGWKCPEVALAYRTAAWSRRELPELFWIVGSPTTRPPAPMQSLTSAVPCSPRRRDASG